MSTGQLRRPVAICDVCAVEELPPGTSRIVEAGGRSIGVFNVNGRLHGLLNRCPHGGAPLCRGLVTGMSSGDGPGSPVTWDREGEIVRCPWHGWEYEIATGETVTKPTLRVKTFQVRVEAGRVVLEV
jgi:nitrite reductase (NADH) small subunit